MSISPHSARPKITVGTLALSMAAFLIACSQVSASQTLAPSNRAAVLPTPTSPPSPDSSVLLSPAATPSVFIASPTTTRPAPAVQANWSVHVYLTALDSHHQRLTVTIVDARGVPEPGSYNLTLALAATPCCPNNPTPPTEPIITTQRYSSYCCTPVVMPVNLQWGGAWAVTGTVTWGGRTERVSESGPVP